MSEENAPAAGLKYDGPLPFREPIVQALKSVFDPEIPVDIYELGLVYEVRLDGDRATVQMTLTSPACPAAEAIPVEVKEKIEMIEGIETVKVDIVWDPPWTPDFMSEGAKLALGFF